MWAIQSKGGRWIYRKPEIDEVHWGVSHREALIFPTRSRAELFMTVNHIPKRYTVVKVRLEVEDEGLGQQTSGDRSDREN